MSKNKSSNEVREKILFFMWQKRYFNKKHTPITNLCNKLSEIPCKSINKEVKRLHAENIIGYKKTHHGLDVYLKPSMKKEIQLIIQKRLEEYYSF
ncbi:hypothetical protein [Methanobrevibacter sp.]|uniref:hypothetical protein n=1 Tax=Methanobrevibacter sp. TaxID=66852 RepID=UPI0038900BFF